MMAGGFLSVQRGILPPVFIVNRCLPLFCEVVPSWKHIGLPLDTVNLFLCSDLLHDGTRRVRVTTIGSRPATLTTVRVCMARLVLPRNFLVTSYPKRRLSFSKEVLGKRAKLEQ